MSILSKTSIIATVLVAFTTGAAAIDGHFNGPYIGADVGFTDEGEFYYGANAGIRTQTYNNIVFGAEATFGDYAVSEDFNISGQTVTAGIDYSWSAVGYIGYVFGLDKRNLIKLGAGYNSFHVFAESQGIKDSDSAGDVRTFVGYERAFVGNWNLRLEANYIKVEGSDGSMATIGLAYQF
ncbi:MAG: outer membrane beta-barrel protein [Kordiimonadaceae bacterium]|nr:outer membrane beta-barrel protein [Kordiimonadaceae bacterium]